MDEESSNGITTFSVQYIYKRMQMLCKGAALQNCFGFVDGTVRPIARPDENQRVDTKGCMP